MSNGAFGRVRLSAESWLPGLLRGREPRVAQEFLNGAKVGAIGQQVGRIGVAEAMRMVRWVIR